MEKMVLIDKYLGRKNATWGEASNRLLFAVGPLQVGVLSDKLTGFLFQRKNKLALLFPYRVCSEGRGKSSQLGFNNNFMRRAHPDDREKVVNISWSLRKKQKRQLHCR